jgi:diguanylate cyclase (GGDEF)-like protein/PAS domain S-box-containing protein
LVIKTRLFAFYKRGSSRAVKPHVYRQLVAALFAPSLVVFTAAALCIGAVGALATHRTGDPITAALAVAAVLVGLARGALIVGFRRRVGAFATVERAKRWEGAWAAVSLAYAAVVGTMAARGIAGAEDPLVHLFAGVGAVGTAGIVAVAAARPNIVLGQLALLFGPLVLGVFLQDNIYYWALAVIGAPFVLMISEMTYSLYETAVRALELASARERLAEELSEQNLRFEAALSNMAQGLCMFDADLRLTVCNRRFAELYGLSPEVVRPGLTLRGLIEHSIARGNHPGYAADDLHALWADQASRGEGMLTHRTLGDGRTLAVNHRPMAGGGHVATVEDITEQKRAAEQVNHLARHDVLTNLPNRLYLRERMSAEVMSARRDRQLAVLCLDLDEFKAVNDTQGHPAGDALLLQVADRLRSLVGDDGFLARLGGDEFAALLPVTNEAAALIQGQTIAAALAQPFTVNGCLTVVGASIGIALAPTHGADADVLLKRADIALYQAKAEGKGVARLFEPAMAEQLVERRALEADMRQAIGRGEFELFYQPLIDIEEDAVSGVEALLRWRHPRLGLLAPDRFIALAEETGLIVPIGEWVLRQACAEAARWAEPLKVAVNLSPVQFRSDTLVASVVSALANAGLPPMRLELEITENVLLQDSEANMAILRRLRELGVRIALDDFGTGYSSLSYLRRFPFDKVKIDKCFVGGEGGGVDGAAIIGAVTGLCRNLGIATTVEGIENEDQLERVRAEGCDEAQGYLFSRPQPLDELKRLFPALRGQGRSREMRRA